MKPSDTVKWGIRGIRQRKMRAALTILGIMVGTAAVIALVSQTEGIQSSILGQIKNLINPFLIRIYEKNGETGTVKRLTSQGRGIT